MEHHVSIAEAIFGLWFFILFFWWIWIIPVGLISLACLMGDMSWRTFKLTVLSFLVFLHVLVIGINVNGQYAPVKSANVFDQFD